MDKILLGLTEKIKINNKELIAKIDTGAEQNSIDTDLAEKLKLGPIIKTTKIKSSHGSGTRPVIEAIIELSGKKLKVNFNLTNRKNLKYNILIGQETLKQGFLVDPSK